MSTVEELLQSVPEDALLAEVRRRRGVKRCACGLYGAAYAKVLGHVCGEPSKQERRGRKRKPTACPHCGEIQPSRGAADIHCKVRVEDEKAGAKRVRYLMKSRKRGPRDRERAAAMLEMSREGKTLREIGKVYGVSRERVRQILEMATQSTPVTLENPGAVEWSCN